jgi:hypothetical protein
MQDNATAHTANKANKSMNVLLSEVFGERVTGQELWPAHSPDLNPCDIYLWKMEEKKSICE